MKGVHVYSCFPASAFIDDNQMATVTVNGVLCEKTYSIVAGGIFIDGTLDGPRFHADLTITTSACPVYPVYPTTTFSEGVIFIS